jgi:hypothetical protein
MLLGGRTTKERFMVTDDERFMRTDADPGGRDFKFAATGMGLLISALVIAAILSAILS